MFWSRMARLLLPATLLLAVAIPLPAWAQDIDPAPADASRSDAPAWLEPRGLSVLDLVGQVPEEHLRGAILVFDEAGVTQYVRGERDGNRVIIDVTMPSYENPFFTEFPCLGRRPLFDEWPVPVPPSQMRVFSAGADVTNQVLTTFWYFEAAQAVPIRNSSSSNGPFERYEEIINASPQFTPSGAIAVPANMGCTYFLRGSVPNLTARFVFNYPQKIFVEPMGSQTFTFHSYVGPGNAGRLDSLSDQLRDRFGGRHDKFNLAIPEGADYVWLNYPPSPVSAYASDGPRLEHNIRLSSSGTYRLIGFGDTKSVDHVVSMGLPLKAQWIDADLDDGDWLERTNPIYQLAAPEYFVPPGVPYDPCMKDGGCSDALLDQIFSTPAQMTLYYYRVRRLQNSNLTQVPLRQVGPGWDPFLSPPEVQVPEEVETDPVQVSASTPIPQPPIHLPMIMSSRLPLPDDAPQQGCPCGWFDEHFRMLDLIPGA